MQRHIISAPSQIRADPYAGVDWYDFRGKVYRPDREHTLIGIVLQSCNIKGSYIRNGLYRRKEKEHLHPSRSILIKLLVELTRILEFSSSLLLPWFSQFFPTSFTPKLENRAEFGSSVRHVSQEVSANSF